MKYELMITAYVRNRIVPRLLLMILLFYAGLDIQGQESNRPNFIIMVSDDLRWDAISINKNKVIQTPHMDSLASQGTYFSNAFVTTPICAVSRASILSGQYAKTHGANDFSTPIDLSKTYPGLLKKVNYYNGFIGKWGVNDSDKDYFEEVVSLFDYWAGSTHQGNYWHEADCNYVVNNGTSEKYDFLCDCPADSRGKKAEQVRIGKANLKNPKHLTTEIIPEKVKSFLKQRDRKKPFCLSISFKTPHGPWSDYDLRYEERFNDSSMPISKSADFDHAKSRPEFLRNSLNGDLEKVKNKSMKGPLQQSIRKYYRMIEGMDFAIGQIREQLDKENLSENTIIIFLSDNGMFLGDHGFRGKWLMYEESVKTPMFIYNPKKKKGHIVDELVANIDVAPTILDFSKISIPEYMDGKSLIALMNSEVEDFRNEIFLEHYFTNGHGKNHIERSKAIRTKEWKYIKYVDQNGPISEELYHISEDSLEMRNLVQQKKEELKLLREIMSNY